jgi:hypothetical protein
MTRFAANRCPPTCVVSHTCPGCRVASACASGPPSRAQHTFRLPCVQTRNTGSSRPSPNDGTIPSASSLRSRSVSPGADADTSAYRNQGESPAVQPRNTERTSPTRRRPGRRISCTRTPNSSADFTSSASGAGCAASTASCGHGPGCSISSQARDASGADADEGSSPVWHSAPCSHAAVTLVILRSLSLFMLGNETLGADA